MTAVRLDLRQARALCLPFSPRLVALALLLIGLAGCASRPGQVGPSAGSAPSSMQCAPYARAVTGVQLSGDGADWWTQAVGRYRREQTPSPGSILVFRRSARLAHGHVSVVEKVLGPRQITVRQANWVHGRLGYGDPVIDISPANDWSMVRVWWAPTASMGVTRYPTYGFIDP